MIKWNSQFLPIQLMPNQVSQNDVLSGSYTIYNIRGKINNDGNLTFSCKNFYYIKFKIIYKLL